MFVTKKVLDNRTKTYTNKVVWHDMPRNSENPKVVADEVIPEAAPKKPKKGNSK